MRQYVLSRGLPGQLPVLQLLVLPVLLALLLEVNSGVKVKAVNWQ
jgi:hypothetical protein